MTDSSLIRRKRRARLAIGISLVAVVFWIWLMWQSYSQGKRGLALFILVPFMLLAMFNAYTGYRRLKRLENESQDGPETR